MLKVYRFILKSTSGDEDGILLIAANDLIEAAGVNEAYKDGEEDAHIYTFANKLRNVYYKGKKAKVILDEYFQVSYPS